jgi:type II secretory pathway pseudopilin PulG
MSISFKAVRQHGVSLVELVMFIVIVSIAVLGVLQVLGSSSARSADPMLRKQALSIAEGLMEEVRLAHFSYCDGADPTAESATVLSPADCAVAEAVGPEAGNSRPYDNVTITWPPLARRRPTTPMRQGMLSLLAMRPRSRSAWIALSVLPARRSVPVRRRPA